MKKIVILYILTILLVNTICAQDLTPVVVISVRNVSLPTGQSFSISATTLYGEDTSYNWSSSDNSIATISQTGILTTVSSGTCTITATGVNTEASGTASITVVDILDNTAIYLEAPNESLPVGGSIQLKASTLPDISEEYDWVSSNSDVATVSSSGLVRGVSSGLVTIYVSGKLSLANAQVLMSVQDQEVFVVTITPAEASVIVGEITKLSAVTTENSINYNENFLWEVDDTDILTILSDGTAIAHKSGNVTITATGSRSGFSKTATVSVQDAGQTTFKKSIPILPGIGFDMESYIIAHNGDSTSATLTLSGYNSNGELIGSAKTYNIAASHKEIIKLSSPGFIDNGTWGADIPNGFISVEIETSSINVDICGYAVFSNTESNGEIIEIKARDNFSKTINTSFFENTNTYIAIKNIEGQNADIDLVLYSKTGEILDSETLSLNGHSLLLSDIKDLFPAQNGSLVSITSQGSISAQLIQYYENGYWSSNSILPASPNNIFIPQINSFSTKNWPVVSIANICDIEVSVSLKFTSSLGDTFDNSISVNLEGNEVSQIEFDEMYFEKVFPTDGILSLSISSNGAVSILTGSIQSSGNIIAYSEGTVSGTSLSALHVVSYSDYKSYLALSNLSGSLASISISLLDDNGNEIASQTASISINETRYMPIYLWLNLESGFSGIIKVSSDNYIFGSVYIENNYNDNVGGFTFPLVKTH